MNLGLLVRRATELACLLSKYEGTVHEAALLRFAVQPIIQEAISGNLVTPYSLGNFPGNRLMYENSIAALPDLADAYAKFSVEASGGPSSRLQELRRQKGCDPLTGDPAEVNPVVLYSA